MNSKLIFCGLTALSALTAGAQEKPNIIFILCDDMGYGDLGCYGQQIMVTPNIDRMAAEGMRFTQAYSGCPVSAPSRASFMTGQHTGHTYIRGNKECWPNSGTVYYGQNADYKVSGQEPYDPKHVIIPEIMKDNGYTTGLFGKWAGGYEGSVSTPATRGIDEFFGYMCQFQAHLYYPNFLNAYSRAAGDKEVRRVVLEDNIKYPMYGPDYKKRTQYSADLIHQKALEWIDKQTADQPFIGFFTYTLPHAELAQPEDSILLTYKGRFCQEKTFGGEPTSRYNPTQNGHAEFAGMITRLDMQVGQILDKLKEKGLDERTMVIFTSDNGPHWEAGADQDFFNRDGLLQGLKLSTHEGGVRIPFIVRWPGKIQAGSVNDHQLAFYDMMPTFSELAGVENYEEKYRNPEVRNDYFDGISIVPTLLGKGQQEQHEFLYWELGQSDMIAVRKGYWKLVVKKGKCVLYDLATDLHEDHDLSAQYPEVLKELKDIVRREHVESSLFKVTLPR